MKKLVALRQHLINAVPALARQPERLLTFVEDGAVEFTRGRNYDHGYRYTARLIVTDWGGDTDTLVVPLLYWLTRYQPNADPDRALQFEAEILANDAWDLSITVNLDERVLTRADASTGRIDVEHIMPAYDTAFDIQAEDLTVYVRDNRSDDDYNKASQTPLDDG